MKQVVVIGLGQFGTHLARELVKQGCEVLVLDSSEERIAEIGDEVHRALVGDARSMEALRASVPEGLDEAVVCLSGSLEASILCTAHLSDLGVKTILAKALNDDHASILRRVGATEVLFPERETAERAARRIAYPVVRDFFPFAEDYRIMEIVTPRSLVGKTVQNTQLRSKYELIALAVRSERRAEYHFMPSASDVLHERDVLILFGRELDLARFSALD
ncbi:MAG: TrkA family potassium uptake protein [Planctomycetes bacterium]|nr:TrkA family potassium uptake protein [Planctomycetota bacterium]